MAARLIYCYSFTCIHNENGFCTLNEVRIGNLGKCMTRTINIQD